MESRKLFFDRLEHRDLPTTVAIIGTGVTPFPGLRSVPGWNTASDTFDASDGSSNGHDTAVAGAIEMVSGFDPAITIMPVRVTNDPTGLTNPSQINAGVRWAVDHGARVINISSGGSTGGSLFGAVPLEEAGIYAHDRGAVLVVSAGNDSYDLDTDSTRVATHYPFAFLAAAIDTTGRIASFSNHGTRAEVYGSLGVDVPTIVRDGSRSTVSGTSFATAALDTLIARVFEYVPGSNSQNIHRIVRAQGVHEAALDGLTREGLRIDLRNPYRPTLDTQPIPAPVPHPMIRQFVIPHFPTWNWRSSFVPRPFPHVWYWHRRFR
ncbi:MAG: hypothetical protein NVSMB9_10210 [Isosphaeraceae bacterium]